MRRNNSFRLIKTNKISECFERGIWGILGLLSLFFILKWIVEESQYHNFYDGYANSHWQMAIHIATFSVTAVLLEQFLPIKAIAPVDWVYKIRPARKIQLNVRDIVIQLFICAVLGLVVGAANNHLVLYPLISMLIRAASLFLGKATIPRLLNAGRAKITTYASGVILDSEIIHNAITSTHLRWCKFSPTSNYSVLILRRILRQPYLILFGAEIMLLCWSLAKALPMHSFVLYMVSWAILGGVLVQCADFSKLGGSTHPKYILLFLHGAVAVVIASFVLQFSNLPMVFVLAVSSIMWCGIARSKERTVKQLSFVETGIFGAISPELLRFYLAGLFPPIIAAFIIASHLI